MLIDRVVRSNRSVLAACLLALASCQAGVSVPAKGKYVDGFSAASGSGAVAGDREALREVLRDHPFGIADDPDWSAYADGIVRRLEAGWPGAKPVIHVHVMPCDSFQAEATPGGGLVLTTGTIAYLRNHPSVASEDHLAFILAHELSHVLLGHPADRTRTQDAVHRVSALVSVAAMLSGAKGAGNVINTQGYVVLASVLGSQLGDATIFPSWSRGQEQQADTLAIDLMARAGYSLSAATDVADVLEAQEREQAARSAASRVSIVQQTRNGVSFQIGPYLAQTLADAGVTHPDAAGRALYLRTYVDREYGDQLVALHTAPFVTAASAPGVTLLLHDTGAVLAASAIASRDPRRAVAMLGTVRHQGLWSGALMGTTLALSGMQLGNQASVTNVLEATSNCPYPTLQLMLLQAQWELARHHPDLALRTYDTADRFFDAPSTIPPRITIAKHTNQGVNVMVLQARCLATGDYGLMQLCSQAGKA